MPISVVCQCGAKLNAKDELAGRTVKCPKCSQSLKIPSGGAAAKPATAQAKTAAAGQAKASNQPQPGAAPAKQPQTKTTATQQKPAKPKAAASEAESGNVGSLFDEIGLAAAPTKSEISCSKCGAGMKEGAVLCISCGFNTQTGKQLSRVSDAEALARREDVYRKQREAAEKDVKAKDNRAQGRAGAGGGELPLDEEKTIKSLLLIATNTEEVFAAMPANNTLLKAFRLPNTVLIAVQMTAFMILLPFAIFSGMLAGMHLGVLWLVFLVAIIAFNYTVLWTMAAAVAGPAHLVLSGMGKSSLTFTDTMCVVFYTIAPYLVVSMIPLVNFAAPFLWCYWLALAFTGHHGVPKKVGFIAAIVGLLVGSIAVSVLIFVLMISLGAAMMSMIPAAPPPGV